MTELFADDCVVAQTGIHFSIEILKKTVIFSRPDLER